MHRRTLLSSIAALAMGCASKPPVSAGATPSAPLQTVVAANPAAGFNYPYILQTPSAGAPELPFLIVEPNNSGYESTAFEDHMRSAIELAQTGLGGRVAQRLKAMLVMPVFPRGPDLYTHSLGRSTMLTTIPSLHRLDLQLLAMIGDAQARIADHGFKLHHKVLLTGFSASAMFVTRFTMIHPRSVCALAAGGLNGFVLLPVSKLDAEDMIYPLGISDLEAITGSAFDRAAWDGVPQFLFMGAEDDNDAIQFEDSYSPSDRAIVQKLVGQKMIPDRWLQCEKIYAGAHAPAHFKTYENLGHGTNSRVNSEVAAFFRQETDGERA